MAVINVDGRGARRYRQCDQSIKSFLAGGFDHAAADHTPRGIIAQVEDKKAGFRHVEAEMHWSRTRSGGLWGYCCRRTRNPVRRIAHSENVIVSGQRGIFVRRIDTAMGSKLIELLSRSVLGVASLAEHMVCGES